MAGVCTTPSPAIDPTTARFFAPIGANEMFVSSLLAWGLQADDSILRLFLDAVASADSGADESRAVAAILRDAAKVEVTVESYATVGNIDIALFSRAQNVVLLVEHKTGTALSIDQIKKYILAMRAADPSGDRRKVGVVLLRPDGAGDARDARADEHGFAAAIKLSHSGLSAVWDSIEKRLDPTVLGLAVREAALEHARGTRGGWAAAEKESRRRLLERISEAAKKEGWGGEVKDLSAVLYYPRIPGSRVRRTEVRLTIGASSRSMITCQVVNRRIATKAGDPHLLDLLPHRTTFAIPTPFPCDHHQKPWMGSDEADLEDQVQVAVRMLGALLDRLEPEAVGATSPEL